MVKAHNELKLYGDSALHKPCIEITSSAVSSDCLQELVTHMSEIMIANGGVGLAANQIGRSEKLFIAKATTGILCFINPIITFKSEKIDFLEEGCLSLPGAFSKTSRHETVRLKWHDEKWQPHEQEFDGLMSQIIQHEVDHLNGKMYIDHFKPLKRQLLLDKHKKYLRSLNKSRFNRS